MRVYLILAALLAGTVCYAKSDVQKLSLIALTTVSSSAANANHANGTSDVTITAGATGVRNCIDMLDFTPVSAGTLRILDGGTTIYALTLIANQGVVRDWSDDQAMCGSAATAFRIKYTTTAAGDYNINYKGFTY